MTTNTGESRVHFGLLAFSFVLCALESFWYLERSSIVHNLKEFCEKESIPLKKIELQN